MFTGKDSIFFSFSSKGPLCTNSLPPTVHVNYSSVIQPLFMTLILSFPLDTKEHDKTGELAECLSSPTHKWHFVVEHLSPFCGCRVGKRKQSWGFRRCSSPIIKLSSRQNGMGQKWAHLFPNEQLLTHND